MNENKIYLNTTKNGKSRFTSFNGLANHSD